MTELVLVNIYLKAFRPADTVYISNSPSCSKGVSANSLKFYERSTNSPVAARQPQSYRNTLFLLPILLSSVTSSAQFSYSCSS